MAARKTSSTLAAKIRRILRDGGSTEHAEGVQWFFKEKIKSHGWYTGKLRSEAKRVRREIQKEYGPSVLLQVADELFAGRNLEEKVFAIFLLENLTSEFGDLEFRLFESWLRRISSWADHDGLVHYLIAPMVAAKPGRSKTVFRWAKSPNRWHRRGWRRQAGPGGARA